MTTAAQTSVVSQVLRVLPAPVLRLLDAWSLRIARQRAQRRQQQWARRKLAQADAARPLPYI
jgi:hypothetical protein